MEAEGVQHVHCHFATHAAFAGLVAHRLTGLPFSFTAHGFDIHVDRRMLARKVDEAAFVVAISDFNRRVILGETRGRHADRVHVVHCGVDPDRFRPRWAAPGVGGETTAEPEATRSVGPAEPPGPPEARPFTVIAVGRLAPVKGHRVLIEACRRLIDEGVSVRCLVAGAGPLRDELAAQALALGLDGRCTLLGGLTAPEVAALMHRADVLVHPSVPTSGNQSEGVPVVLMEAMATGLPVVASRITGIPELVEDGVTGLLVEPGDAAGVAAALRRIHDDPALVALLGRAARERVMADFDLDANAARLADLMRAAATGRDAVATGAPAPVPGMVA
jgi:glycosyltransferase involved in cell wall biosynthesis